MNRADRKGGGTSVGGPAGKRGPADAGSHHREGALTALSDATKDSSTWPLIAGMTVLALTGAGVALRRRAAG